MAVEANHQGLETSLRKPMKELRIILPMQEEVNEAREGALKNR